MKKLVYTVQGFDSTQQEELLCELLPDVLRAYGSDGNVEADARSASVSFSVPRTTACQALEQSVNDALAAHGMQLLSPPGVRYYAYVGPKNGQRKGISVSAFVASLIAAVSVTLVVTMLLTAVISSVYWSGKNIVGAPSVGNDDAPSQGIGAIADDKTLSLVDQLIRDYAYEGINQEDLMQAVIQAYVAATGDIYAEYYTKEEFDELTKESQGQMEGIGVSVINGKYEGRNAIKIIMITPGAPASREDANGNKLRTGDLVVAVKIGDEYQTVDEIGGYMMALNKLRGTAGTQAEFMVMRPEDGGYTPLYFSITREAFEVASVSGKVSETDPSVGIVSILEFDLPTPEQFEKEVDALLAQGCTKFVFDVRNNPGGDLESIKAVLSYFLSEGDLIVSTKDKNGNEKYDVVKESMHTGSYAACNVTKDEIGKYKDLEFCVLTNGNTASAAELFTATVRDYQLGTIVGQTTYGKGCMQSIFDLSTAGYYYKLYGVEGGLRITTKMYFPACGESYHGIGIAPHVEVALPDNVAKEYSIYELISDYEDLDTQLQAALEQLK